MPPLFMCTWGDIRLFAESLEWDAGLTQVVHDLSSGNRHPVQPRGERANKSRMVVIFDAFTGVSDSPPDQYRKFAATKGETRLFVHPMDGAYMAVIGDLEPQIDSDSNVRATVEFIRDDDATPVLLAGPGATAIAGETSVAAAAEQASAELARAGIGFPPRRAAKIDFRKSVRVSVKAAFEADLDADVSANLSATAQATFRAEAAVDVGVMAAADASVMAFGSAYQRALSEAQTTPVATESGMPTPTAFAFAYACAATMTDAAAASASWADSDDVATRKIIIDAARISESIALMIELGRFEFDLSLFPAFRSAIMLGASVREAAEAASADTPTVFALRIEEPISLLPLCARIYGGRQAQTRARQVASLNDIRTAGWLDPGFYLFPTRPTRGRTVGL